MPVSKSHYAYLVIPRDKQGRFMTPHYAEGVTARQAISWTEKYYNEKEIEVETFVVVDLDDVIEFERYTPDPVVVWRQRF